MSAGSFLLAIATLAIAAPAIAGITIEGAYARTASPMAKSGAVFMSILNDGDTDDRLISVRSDAAVKVGLHRNMDMGGGVAGMGEAEDGFAVPAGGRHDLMRGGDHVMFMGLTGHWADGDRIPVILTFEKAGEITIQVPVDQSR